MQKKIAAVISLSSLQRDVNCRNKHWRFFALIRLGVMMLFMLLYCTWHQHAHAVISEPFAQGYVDSVTVTEDTFEIQGWAGASIPSHRIVAVSIKFGRETIYEGRFERLDRPDVANATGRADWIRSGWRVVAPMPSFLRSGTHTVRVEIKLDTGHVVDLPVRPDAAKVTFGNTSHPLQKLFLWTVLIALCCLVILNFSYLEPISRRLNRAFHVHISEWMVAAATLLITFIVFIVVGFTGSSLAIGIKSTSYIEADSLRIFGSPKPIRSDEWAVFTPLAIAQVNHSPQFPVINKNLGSDGQNMLIVGMTGLPVHHLSAVAKPATWGFHLFDLKRALAWYWWFPIFGSLFALWGVFSILVPGQWRLGLVTALSFCLSPYVVAWSQWPAYTVFFPSVAFCCAVQILRAKKTIPLLALSLILGLAVAGFILVLYPPSQIPVAYLYTLITIGIVLRDRLYSNFDSGKLFALGIAGAIAGAIVWVWWLDARSAIWAMVNTVYPGQRNMVVGGTVVFSDLLRGFTNLVTLYRLDGTYTNHSEIASFFYYFPSALFLAGVLIARRRLGIITWIILGFIAWTLLFMMAGFPQWLAKLTLWGRVPAPRADLALGLAFILLCGILFATYKSEEQVFKIKQKVAAVVTALSGAIIVFYAMSKMPDGVLVGISPGVAVGMFLMITLTSVWLALGNARKYFILTLSFAAASTLMFNPFVLATSKLTLAPSVKDVVYSSSQENNSSPKRVLVLESHIPAVMLLASGVPVVNGVFYYPQKTLWSNLDPSSQELNIYNRYQHLFFTSDGDGSNNSFRLESPQADVVRVAINLEKFDFKLTGAEILSTPIGNEPSLKRNSTVEFVRRTDNWSWFRVKAD